MLPLTTFRSHSKILNKFYIDTDRKRHFRCTPEKKNVPRVDVQDSRRTRCFFPVSFNIFCSDVQRNLSIVPFSRSVGAFAAIATRIKSDKQNSLEFFFSEYYYSSFWLFNENNENDLSA